jgi:hypothetical protein|tara:strand:+ start:22999 stop:25815 length:2817 start_codon:yes stop_codon:yes gene_type:complete
MNVAHYSRFIILCICLSSELSAGAYDATPLRGALSPEPYFQTSLGRENHRFENAVINRYRLYGFYARQAEHHLKLNEIPDLLLPYPGLEGGRRGHWGNTNEKLSSAILNRTEEPRYHRLVNRSPKGNQYVCVSHKDTQSVCLFSNSSPSMIKVILNAELSAPIHAFSHKVDRFGFAMTSKGQDYLINRGTEWHQGLKKAVAVINDGYHLYEGKVIFRRIVGQISLLDYPSVSCHDTTAVYTRYLEWQGNTPALNFPLPIEVQLLKNPKIKITKSGGAWLAVVSDGTRQLTHRVRSSEKMSNVSLRAEAGKIWVSFPALKKGTMIQMSSWISSTADKQVSIPDIQTVKLSSYLNGGARYFTKDITVKGTVNADPAAQGSAYEIDDIPVPSENPYGTPMTTCGLTFAEDGSAYISTLVGDVWKVTGLNASLDDVKWQRFASGLNSPLGMEMVDGVLHVLTQHKILQLHDINKDGEADLVKPFTKGNFPSGRLHDLRRDAKGNFYCSHVSGIYRISPDGKIIEKVSSGSRNPLGIGVRSDGLALSDSSEGNKSNGTCSIFESYHPENEKTAAKNRRVLYLPRGIDNSPGSRIFMNSSNFGPLGKSIMGVSYGTGRIYQIMRDPNHGSPQAALRLLPGEFSSGAARLASNPKDGQLYVVGLDGWGDFGTTEGCFHRVRYSGKDELLPLSWKAYNNGLSVRFNIPVDPKSISREKLFLQQWNYTDSLHTYGSAEYSVKDPSKLGHDRVKVASVYFSEDRKEMFINAPDVLPSMCTQIYGQLKSITGVELTLDLYATINELPNQSLKGRPALSTKQRRLVVPYKKSNGNTYATITGFFDKLAGRDLIKRPVGPVVAYKNNELNYAWVHKNIIVGNACIACHGPNTKYDFATYESLMKAIDLKHPDKSHLLGMMASKSMPLFPMPTVAPEMQKALRTWIQMGAPK